MGDIRIYGANQHNLRNVDVTIPRNSLTVVTGLSGSGKSSLAFDTLYAEGQRRYVESLSAYARQFLDQMEKPDVEKIEGLSPAIAIEQRTTGGNPRSIVATVTEIHDYLRLLYGSVGVAHCPKCGREVVRQSAEQVVESILKLSSNAKLRIILYAPVVKGKKGRHEETLAEIKRQGFARVRIDGTMFPVDELPELDKKKSHNIDVVVDRIVLPCDRTRLTDSVELGLKAGHGIIYVEQLSERGDGSAKPIQTTYSELNACEHCGISFDELKPRSFSFNSPFGACPECGGLGAIYYFDEDLVVPDKTLPLRECIHPWRRAGHNAIMYYNALLEQIAKQYKVNLSTPYEKLSPAFRKKLMHGFDDDLVLPWRSVDKPFEGVLATLQRRLNEAEDDEHREKLEIYQSEKQCPACHGTRLRPESRAVTVCGKTIVDVMAMSVKDCLAHFRSVDLPSEMKEVHKEILKRLQFLDDVGLDYLTLDRPSSSLSGGEMQRIRLATQIGSGLTGVLYVLDEPTIGLHPRDNERLIATLKGLRDKGNTVVIVEHDEEMMRTADYIIDLGPGAGREGGKVMYQGDFEGLLKCGSLTSDYLTGKKAISAPSTQNSQLKTQNYLTISGCTGHNLKNVTARIPAVAFSTVMVAFAKDQTGFVPHYALFKGSPIPIADNMPEKMRERLITQALALHAKEIAGWCRTRGIVLNRWGVDCGGKQWAAVNNFAKIARQTCGIGLMPMAGRAGRNWNPFVRSRIADPRNETVLCEDKTNGWRWLAWNSDYWKETAQKAWLGEVGTPGSLSLFDGQRHGEYAAQVAAEYLEYKVALSDGRTDYKWRLVGPHNDLGDATAMCYALAGAFGISASGYIPPPPKKSAIGRGGKPRYTFKRGRWK